MTSTNIFWAAAGFMAGLAATFFLLRLWSQRSATLPRLNLWVVASVLVFFAGALWIYSRVGRPDAIAANGAGAISNDAMPAHATGGSADAGSMQEVVARLVTKLASGNGTDADWQLLQQSYEFLGDSAAAASAAQHQLPADALMQAMTLNSAATTAAAPTDFNASATADAARYRQQVTANPRDVAAWRGLAEASRSARQFEPAVEAYTQLIALKAMTADDWANRADAAASLRNTLNNDITRDALQQALKLNSRHAKALWLQASLQLEQHQYAAALKTWRQLRALIPDQSPDANIVDANIAEATALSATGKSNAAADKPVNAEPHLTGSVSVGKAVPEAQRGSFKGATLYVFARASDSPAPVAVYKTVVNDWPIKFELSDAQAMLPTRKLSQYDAVLVQARISRSGSALAQAGDWQSAAITVKTNATAALALLLDQQTPAQVNP